MQASLTVYNFENKMAVEAKKEDFVFCSLFWFLDDYILSLKLGFWKYLFSCIYGIHQGKLGPQLFEIVIQN